MTSRNQYYLPRCNFSFNKSELRSATMTSIKGLKIEAYSGPFFLMHQAITVRINPDPTTPYNTTSHARRRALAVKKNNCQKNNRTEKRDVRGQPHIQVVWMSMSLQSHKVNKKHIRMYILVGIHGQHHLNYHLDDKKINILKNKNNVPNR